MPREKVLVFYPAFLPLIIPDTSFLAALKPSLLMVLFPIFQVKQKNAQSESQSPR
jgi:hypothetical protein